MKNNKNTPQQKNFYFALYASIAAIALVAAIATYSNLHSLSNKFSLAQNKNPAGQNSPPIHNPSSNQNQSNYQIDNSQQNILVEPVSNNQSQSYLDKKNQLAKSSEPKSLKNYLAPSDRRQNVNSEPKSKLTDDTKKSAADVLKMPQISSPTPAEKNLPENDSRQNETQNENSSSNSQTAVFTSGDDEQNFTSFDDENQKMAWPVFGQIVMNFDDKNLVYDKTLEQYRTNDCISLSADVGEQVKASADGIVKLITKTNEGGNTIVIDHGNNWSTTYSQLQDDLLVNEGDFVKKGQAIGGVNKPTKYGVLLGNHLDFKITHNDVSVDPKDIMTKNQ